VTKRFAVIAGGGTGGHVLPALEIAEALATEGHDRASIAFIGSRRGQEATMLAGRGFPMTLLPGRGIQRSFSPRAILDNVGAALGLSAAAALALVSIVRHRPKIVVAVGGYASFAAGLAAIVTRVPLVLVNTDAVPGAVNALFGRYATASAVGFPGSTLPRAEVTGTPVRPEFAAVDRSTSGRRTARQALDLPTDRTTVAVFGGSLGSRRINDAVVGLAERWASRGDLTLYHVTGARDFDQLAATVVDETDNGGLVRRMVRYEDQMPTLVAAADVMVCRSGAMTVAELAVAGVPAVLVPLPGAPRDHQTENARALVAVGGAVLVPDERCTPERLEDELNRILSDPTTSESMGRAASTLGHPDAAALVAQLVERHAS
jgi:UDP-N-acetylglucosamine--N-acetylmuramyl-(pentapeptide) pyrophosphoryl-undecaprenol N-acetylglucosamine transferase